MEIIDRNTDENHSNSPTKTSSETFGAGEGLSDVKDCCAVATSIPKDKGVSKNNEAEQDHKENTSTSKWSKFTKVLQFGLAAGSDTNLTETTPSQSEENHSKRGSLGKLFRYGFAQKNPNLENVESLEGIPLPTNKRSSLLRMFKHGKSEDSNKKPESEEKEPQNHNPVETKQSRGGLKNMIKQKFSFEKKVSDNENVLSNTEPLFSTQGDAHSSESKRRSLGKMFRLKQSHHNMKSDTHDLQQASGSAAKLQENMTEIKLDDGSNPEVN